MDAEQQQQRAERTTDDAKDGLEPEYPQGVRMASIVASLFASIFIVAVSQTVLAAAIPTVTSNFKTNDDVSWYSTGEQISAVALLLPFGRMYALLNNKWVYLSSVVVYLVGSAVCGAAPTSTVFIIGRTIQGAGLAGVFGGTFILIARITPLRTRSLYAGLCGAAYAIAAVVGPVIGGAFTTRVSWRWCFYFNLPIGGVFLIIIFVFLPRSLAVDSQELKDMPLLQKIIKFDPLGSLILLGCLVCLVLALQWGGAQYAWNSGQVIAVLVVFGCTLIPWLWLQYKQGDEATVPFSLVKQRTVAASVLYLLFLNGSFGIFIFYLPIWFQSIDGDSAEGSGVKQLALSISTAISSIIAGGLVAVIGWYNPFLILGPVFSTAGAAMLIKIQPGTSTAYTLGAQILGGVGVGIGAEQANVAVQAVLPREKISMGTSLTLFARLLGFGLAVPIGQNLLQQALSDRLGAAVAGQVFGGGGVTDIRGNLERVFGAGTPELQDALEDVNFALVQTFLVGLVMAAVSFPFSLLVEWKSVKNAPKHRGEEGTDKTCEVADENMAQEMDDMSGKR